jgi:glutamine synthetase
MTAAPFGMFAIADLSGMVRGKSFGHHRRAATIAGGLAWVPANLIISPFGTLPADNPFGPMGEIGLRADEGTHVRLPAGPSAPETDLYLCDIVDESGTPWDACPRTALRQAVEQLRAETGLTMKLAFEHEFTLVGDPYGRDPSFSLAAIRRAGALASEIDTLLHDAGMPVEQFVPEFGLGQFEIASTPRDPLTACDHAILSREIIRDAARRAGVHASFVPKASPGAPGNGIHAHFSLWDGGRPVLAADGWLSAVGGAFAAGLVDHAEALLFFTTGSANSYLRIRPHSWVGAYACVGTRNREAMIRLCPRSGATTGPLPKASLEFRVVDATANTYLAIAALIHAGLDGIRRALPAPPNMVGDPSDIPAGQKGKPAIRALPDSLERAIAAFEADKTMNKAFRPLLIEALLSVRRGDLRHAQGIDAAELAKQLAAIY